MQIAVVGAGAAAICRAAGVGAELCPVLADAAGRSWDVLALADGVTPLLRGNIRAKCLLLPGDSDPLLLANIRAAQVVSCGLSPRDTLTLSSLAGAERLLCLQRGVVTPYGSLLEPQELPLSPDFNALTDEDALLAAGLRLLCTEARNDRCNMPPDLL